MGWGGVNYDHAFEVLSVLLKQKCPALSLERSKTCKMLSFRIY